ncbi:MAG: hypothetical protein AB7J32_07560 [Pseudonocardia sp.]
MTSHTTAGRAAPTRPGKEFAGVAFSAWAAAFAVGVLIHELQFIQPPFAFNTLIVTTAFAVLLRPSAVWRVILLLALLVVELLVVLPNPQNHLMFIGVVGATIVPWWLWLRWRAPEQAGSPAVMYERVAPYLRLGFILMWYFAAFAKMNTGFENAASTCSVWILELIPGVTVPTLLVPAVILGTQALELTVPTLLLFHRTRWLAIILGFGFHLVSALAGHSAFSGFGWSFYLLFLPPVVLARAVVLARRSLPEIARRAVAVVVAHSPAAVVTFAALWMAAAAIIPVAYDRPWMLRRWGACLLCVLWMGLTGALLVRLRRHWLPHPPTAVPPGPRASLRVRNGLFLLGFVALLATAAMPYLGLKTRAAFTMYSNVRTEPGHWNHLLIPEAVRIFHWQDGDFVLLGSDDPLLAQEFAEQDAEHTVLLSARRIAADHPTATVRYLLDGVEHESVVSADPVLGQPISAEQDWFGAMRPFVEGNTCQH